MMNLTDAMRSFLISNLSRMGEEGREGRDQDRIPRQKKATSAFFKVKIGKKRRKLLQKKSRCSKAL